MYIRVWKSTHEEGLVPRFFHEVWAQSHNNENPLENWERYEKKDAYSFHALVGGLLAALAGGFTIVFLPYIGTPCIILGICLWGIAWVNSPKRHEHDWHHKEFFERVERLFNLFGVQPSPEIGGLAKEEFAGLVAGSLRTQMSIADTKQGFARFPDYEQFKRMHAAALEWGLCKEKYDEYDPKKVGK